MKIHPIQTYYRLLRRFEGKELSLRKQLCLAYLRWLETEKPQDRDDFVELAKKFRKGRAGGHRTILERKARENFKKARIRKNTEASREGARAFNEKLQETGRGIFTEEQLSNRSQMWKEIVAKQLANNDHPQARTFVVTKPDGTQLAVHNMCGYSRTQGLDGSVLQRIARTPWKLRSSKGYTARFWDPETDMDIPWAEGFELPPRLKAKYGLE